LLSPLLVELHPGEVLYIPEYWSHHVTSLTPSFSLNTWTPTHTSP
jgi:ribosomal protein L16 Arg81 hydroxylase